MLKVGHARAAGGSPPDETPFDRVRARTELALAPIELAAHQLLSRPLRDHELAEVRSASTALARALGRLQHQGIVQPARRIAALFETDEPDRSTGVELAGAIEDTRTMLASAAAQLASNPSTTSVVIAIGDPCAAFDTVLWVLAHHGHRIRHAEGLDPSGHADADAVVVHAGANAEASARTLLPAVAERYPCPVIVLHDEHSAQARYELARHATTLLPESTDPAEISEEVLRQRAAFTTDRRAAVWGHPTAAARLRSHGFDVCEVSDLASLDTTEFDALVLGPELPVAARYRVTHLLRVAPGTRRTPVVWHGPLSPSFALTAAHLGVSVADGFDDTTAAALTCEIRRAAADVDPVANRPDTILAWGAARLLIDRSLIASQRANAPAALAVVRVSEDPSGATHREVADQLAREFRRGDVVGRGDLGDFVVSLAGIGSRTALDRLTGLAGRLGGNTRIGVADFPAAGRTADDLVRAATAAVERAETAHGPSVVSTGWRPVHRQPTDVIVVDRDVVLGDMVAGALAPLDLHVSVIADGHEALSQLRTCSPDDLPRLLLVDLDLGGADGRALLSSLAQTGVLADVRVLAMASKGAESDLRMALDHGASDIIRKPFSTTILQHRVSQVLGA